MVGKHNKTAYLKVVLTFERMDKDSLLKKCRKVVVERYIGGEK